MQALVTLAPGKVNACDSEDTNAENTTTPLDLSRVTLKRVEGIKNHFDSFGNIEGPVWINDALYFSNISGGENPPPSVIWKWIPGSAPTVVVVDAGSNGLAVDAEGRLVAAMHSDGTVSVRSLDRLTEASPVIKTAEGQRFNSPNDLILSEKGQLYFTDPTWQAKKPYPQASARAYRVTQGRAEAIGTLHQPENPNGITLSTDESKLYIGGVNGLYIYQVDESGAVSKEGTLVTSKHLSERSGIDGLGRDCAGRIYVTVHSENLVVVLSKNDEEVGALAVPGATGITNVAFGGKDRKTLYVTSLGAEPKLHEAELPVRGYPY